MTRAVCILFFILILTSCSNTDILPTSNTDITHGSITKIYIYHCSESSIPFEEYEIDFSQKKFTILVRGGFIGMTNEVKKDNPTIKILEDESINAFLLTAQEKGFTEWEKFYDNDVVDGGHQWGILVSFSDGTEKEIRGSNAYPETWNEICDAFQNLTGENILFTKSD